MNTPDFQRDFSIDEVSSSSVKAFMNRVFGLMSLALIISGITAFQFSETMLSMLQGGGTLMVYALMFAPFIFILVMNFGFNKLSPMALTVTFAAFAVVMGMSLSTIFLVYSHCQSVLHHCRTFWYHGHLGLHHTNGFDQNGHLLNDGLVWNDHRLLGELVHAQ